MNSNINDSKVALVTGANKGIGFEVCKQLASRGFHVFVGARKKEEGLRACSELARSGSKVDPVELDVTKPDSIQCAADYIRTKTGSLHVLVNNAGICEDPQTSVLELSADVFNRTLATNTLGPLLLTQLLCPLLANSRAGRIINVSSGLGALHQMSSGYPSYRISKAALNAFTRIAAAELAPKKVAVNAVSPGWVRTDMGGAEATSSVEEGADTIVWLATDAPQHLTGQFVQDRKAIDW